MAQAQPRLSSVLDTAGQVVLLDWSDLRARVNPQTATIYDELQTPSAIEMRHRRALASGQMQKIAAQERRKKWMASRASSRCRDAA